VPLTVCVFNAIIWQILALNYNVLSSSESDFATSWGSVYSVVFTTTLAFLLVFRLNRVALRWWETRRMWGAIVAHIRVLTGEICEHLNHSPKLRDRAVAWTAAFLVASKQILRGEKYISGDELAGILTPVEVSLLQAAKHPPLYASGEVRHAIQRALHIDHSTPDGIATSWSSIARSLETSINELIHNIGGMERVRVTPLPIVYVSHLRTFLLVYLLSLPYLYGHLWGYFTVPAVFVTSFALLGIDGASAECECPFQKNRVNHLDMEAYCLTAMNSILQILIHAADMERRDDEKGDAGVETIIEEDTERHCVLEVPSHHDDSLQ